MFEGHKVTQSMYFEDGGQKKFKGIQRILQERGLWEDHLRLECKQERNTSCCARHLLWRQTDLKLQQTAISLEVTGREHIFELIPQFHAETNLIERIWGRSKRVCRSQCDY